MKLSLRSTLIASFASLHDEMLMQKPRAGYLT
jgi:hypothetical protein